MSTPVVLPVLRLAVLCQSIEADRKDRPFALEVPIHTLRWPKGHQGGYRPPTLELYVQVQDAVGAFNVRGVLRAFGSDTELYRSPPVQVVFSGTEHRVVPLEFGLRLNGLSFPRPDAYELHLFFNQVSIHEAGGRIPIPFPPVRVTVLPADDTDTDGGIQ